jgi:hypothetical protein
MKFTESGMRRKEHGAALIGIVLFVSLLGFGIVASYIIVS